MKRTVLSILAGVLLVGPLSARDKQPQTIQVEIAAPLAITKDAAQHTFIAADYQLKEVRENGLSFSKTDMAGFVNANYLPTLAFSEADGKTMVMLSCKLRLTGITIPATVRMKEKDLHERYGDLLAQIKRDVEKRSSSSQ